MTSLPKKENASESGQALVLVLLSLAVVLTLVLFVLSRSITDISVSTNQEESVRAFSAAEAGIEKALVIGSGTGTSTAIGNASYTSNVTSFSFGTKVFNYPILLSSGDSMTTWFVSHDANDNLVCDGNNPCFSSTAPTDVANFIKICWGKPGASSSSNTTPAVELTVYYESTPGDLSTLKVARGTYDPNYTSRQAFNSFGAGFTTNCTIDTTSYAFQKIVLYSDLGIPASAFNNPNGLQFARVKMLYNTDTPQPIGTSVNFGGNSPLPSQGQDIVSTGTAGGTATLPQSTRKIEVFQGWPEAPNIFEYAVYGSNVSGGLIKQ